MESLTFSIFIFRKKAHLQLFIEEGEIPTFLKMAATPNIQAVTLCGCSMPLSPCSHEKWAKTMCTPAEDLVKTAIHWSMQSKRKAQRHKNPSWLGVRNQALVWTFHWCEISKHTEFHLTPFHPKSVQSHTQRIQVLLQPTGLHFSYSIFYSLVNQSGVL